MSVIRADQRALRRAGPSVAIFYPDAPAAAPRRRGAARGGQLLGPAERLVFADPDLAFALMRLATSGHALPAPVRAFAESTWRRPSVRAYVEHARPPHAPV